MNKITTGQLTTSLLLSQAFMLMCFSAPVSTEYLIGAVIAFAVQAVLCIPVIMLYRKGFSFEDYCKSGHRFVPCSLALYFILRGGVSFLLVWNCSEQLSLPFSEPLVTAVLIGAVCLYTSSLGISAFSRASGMVFGIMLLTLVILIAGAWQMADLAEISFAGESSVLYSSLRILSVSDTLPLFFVLMSFTGGKSTAKSLSFLPLGFLLTEIIFFLCISIPGDITNNAPYPYFMLTAVSQPLSEQRADSLYLILFVMLCVIRLTLLTVLSAHLMRMVFRRAKYLSITALVLMIGAAAFFSMINYTGNIFCIGGIVYTASVLPVILFIKSKSRGKEQKV